MRANEQFANKGYTVRIEQSQLLFGRQRAIVSDGSGGELTYPMPARIFFHFQILLFLVVAPAVTFGLQAEDVAQTIEQLRSVKMPNDWGNDVPTPVIPLLPQLKHQLLALFQKVLVDEGARATQFAATATLRSKMLTHLQAAGVWIEDSYTYGGITELEVSRPRGHPDLLVFRIDLGIDCGEDNSLYVFQRRKGRWRMVIAIESNGYKEVFGGLDSLQYRISPLDGQGRWFLVYLHQIPSCTSVWNGISYRVVRSGASAEKPVVVLARGERLHRGDYEPRLRVNGESFRLDFAGESLASLPSVRMHVVRYRIVGSRATRIPPLAHSPEGFLHEWAGLPWREARRWSRIAGQQVRGMHEQLGAMELDFVQPCPGGSRWQIGVSMRELKPDPPALKTLYATVVRQGQTYLLTQIGHVRPAGCPGAKQVQGE